MNEFCLAVYNFFRDKCDKITNSPEYFEFESWDDMLTQIKNDFDVALWAITEIPFWAMPEEYDESIKVGYDENDNVVFKLDDLYFTTNDDNTDITLVKPITKLVEITTWVPCSESDSMQDTIDNLYKQQGGRRI